MWHTRENPQPDYFRISYMEIVHNLSLCNNGKKFCTLLEEEVLQDHVVSKKALVCFFSYKGNTGAERCCVRWTEFSELLKGS